MAGFWFDENPNPHSVAERNVKWWGYPISQGSKRVVVIHEAVIKPDLDGQDSTAENVARYASNTGAPTQNPRRKVSWHDTTDTDSAIHMCPLLALCAHVGNFNTPSVGIEQGFDGSFESLDPFVKFLYLFTCGVTCAWRLQQMGSPPVHISAQEAFAGARGWTTHRELQPDIRQDPRWSPATVKGFGELVAWAYNGGRIIGIGDKGPEVRAAQVELQSLGYDVGVIDGIAGPRFDGAVRAWERDHTKPSTGLWAPWVHEEEEEPVEIQGWVDAVEEYPGRVHIVGWGGHPNGQAVAVTVKVGDTVRVTVPTKQRGDVMEAWPTISNPPGFELDVAVQPGTYPLVVSVSGSGDVREILAAEVTVPGAGVDLTAARNYIHDAQDLLDKALEALDDK